MSAAENKGAPRDPDRLGKTGGRSNGGRGGVPSVTRLLGKALGKGWMKRAGRGKANRGGGGAARGFRQRVIVKALVVRYGRRSGGSRGGRAGTSRGGASLVRHVRYLGRDGTSQTGERGQFYDREVNGLNADELTKVWHAEAAPDQHHFRLIISPEKGEQITDLTGYVREVMGRVEGDLQQIGDHRSDQLEWVAINHFNTDQPHAHVLIRGVTGPLVERSDSVGRDGRSEAGTEWNVERGGEGAGNPVMEDRSVALPPGHRVIAPDRARGLILPREFVSHGIRTRAEEFATELLGERSLDEVRHAREKEVGAERWTGLDRQIARQIELQNPSTTPVKPGEPRPAAARRIDVAPERLAGVRPHERGLLVRRLQTLEQYGLAIPTRGSSWRVEPDFRQRLMALGARGDIIKTLYGSLGAEAGRVVPFGLSDRLSGRVARPLEGVVVDHGVVDEMTLERYLVVRDRRGQDHYASVREGETYDRIQKGTAVSLGAASAERQAGIEEMIRVAGESSTYSRSAHRVELAKRTELTTADRQRLLDLTSRQAEQLAGRSGTGVERGEPVRAGLFKIDADLLRRHAQRVTSRAVTDVRILAGGRDPAERVDRGSRQSQGRSRADRFAPESGRSASPRGRSRQSRGRNDRDDMELGD